MRFTNILASFIFGALIWWWMLYLGWYIHLDQLTDVFGVQSDEEFQPVEFSPEWYQMYGDEAQG